MNRRTIQYWKLKKSKRYLRQPPVLQTRKLQSEKLIDLFKSTELQYFFKYKVVSTYFKKLHF